MGAVQKLATVVIVGLVALSTLLVVYLADENNRMSAEVQEKDEVAVERGIKTFIANCMVCHGPAGEGYSEPGAEGTGRIGAPLGGDTELGRAAQERNQVTDPTARAERYKQLVEVINNGRGLMPAWGTGLLESEISLRDGHLWMRSRTFRPGAAYDEPWTTARDDMLMPATSFGLRYFGELEDGSRGWASDWRRADMFPEAMEMVIHAEPGAPAVRSVISLQPLRFP